MRGSIRSERGANRHRAKEAHHPDQGYHDPFPTWHQQNYNRRHTNYVPWQDTCQDEELLNKAATVLIDRFESDIRPVFLEQSSVYGAGILIPQVTRSAGWPKVMIVLTLQVYCFVFLNFAVQTTLLVALQREENVMDAYSGQMYLCDFGGGNIDDCPHSPSCLGPGGTMISGSRLYDYDSWRTRSFLTNSLKSLFPVNEDDIEDSIDPGEYGAQSRYIRWLCGFIFMMEVMNELMLIFNMLKLLCTIPTADESWIRLVDIGEEEERIALCIAGMPARWKCVNVVLILVPKTMLWGLTATAGITFLMETADLADMIVNAVSLCFILQLDESICVNLMSGQIGELMKDIGDFRDEKVEADKRRKSIERTRPRKATVNGMGQENKEEVASAKFSLRNFLLLLPYEFFLALSLTIIAISLYYFQRCEWKQDGQWFQSRPVFEPKVSTYSALNTYFPYFFPTEYTSRPVWQMPAELTI